MPGKHGDERDIRIGQNIAAIRLSKRPKLGQAELGRRIGAESATTMWRYEHGWHCPIDKLEAIARELDVTVDVLLKGADAAQTPANDSMSPTQAELLRIAQRGLEAALDGSPEAQKTFWADVLEHAERLRKRR
jgi:transcriptional regulator with XRE-family HTH domain